MVLRLQKGCFGGCCGLVPGSFWQSKSARKKNGVKNKSYAIWSIFRKIRPFWKKIRRFWKKSELLAENPDFSSDYPKNPAKSSRKSWDYPPKARIIQKILLKARIIRQKLGLSAKSSDYPPKARMVQSKIGPIFFPGLRLTSTIIDRQSIIKTGHQNPYDHPSLPPPHADNTSI